MAEEHCEGGPVCHKFFENRRVPHFSYSLLGKVLPVVVELIQVIGKDADDPYSAPDPGPVQGVREVEPIPD